MVREHAFLPFLALTALEKSAWSVVLSSAVLACLALSSEMRLANLSTSGTAVLASIAGLAAALATRAAVFLVVFGLGSLILLAALAAVSVSTGALAFSFLPLFLPFLSGVDPVTTDGPAHLVSVPVESVSLNDSPCTAHQVAVRLVRVVRGQAVIEGNVLLHGFTLAQVMQLSRVRQEPDPKS